MYHYAIHPLYDCFMLIEPSLTIFGMGKVITSGHAQLASQAHGHFRHTFSPLLFNSLFFSFNPAAAVNSEVQYWVTGSTTEFIALARHKAECCSLQTDSVTLPIQSWLSPLKQGNQLVVLLTEEPRGKEVWPYPRLFSCSNGSLKLSKSS